MSYALISGANLAAISSILAMMVLWQHSQVAWDMK
jgi:hypothetical protein